MPFGPEPLLHGVGHEDKDFGKDLSRDTSRDVHRNDEDGQL